MCVIKQWSCCGLPAVWAGWAVLVCLFRVAFKTKSEAADGGKDAVKIGKDKS